MVDLGFLGPLFAALGATMATIIGATYTARHLGRLGLGDDQLKVNATLRELAAVSEAKVVIQAEENATLRARLVATQHDLDNCARQRDNAYAELRRTADRPKP